MVSRCAEARTKGSKPLWCFDRPQKLPNMLLQNFHDSLHSSPEQLTNRRHAMFSHILFLHWYNFAEYLTWVCCLLGEAWSFPNQKHNIYQRTKESGRFDLGIIWTASSRSRVQPHNPKQKKKEASLQNPIMIPQKCKFQVWQKNWFSFIHSHICWQL